MVVRSTPAAVQEVPAGGSLYVCSALQVSSTANGGAAKPSRKSHRCVLRGADVLLERFGVTDPEVFRILSQTALGVEDVKAPPARFTSLAYVQQASARTPASHAASTLPARSSATWMATPALRLC